MVYPDSDKISRVPSYSGYFQVFLNFDYETFTPFGLLSQTIRLSIQIHIEVLQPQNASILVWPILRPLAATSRISFDFFSSGYLDVSVPLVSSFQ